MKLYYTQFFNGDFSDSKVFTTLDGAFRHLYDDDYVNVVVEKVENGKGFGQTFYMDKVRGDADKCEEIVIEFDTDENFHIGDTCYVVRLDDEMLRDVYHLVTSSFEKAIGHTDNCDMTCSKKYSRVVNAHPYNGEKRIGKYWYSIGFCECESVALRKSDYSWMILKYTVEK